jgi:hypothetical protein
MDELEQHFAEAMEDAQGDYPDVGEADLAFEMAIAVALQHDDRAEAAQWLTGTLGFLPESYKISVAHFG